MPRVELNGEWLHRGNAGQMVRRRAKAASISTEVCNHTFRGTGITAYLENESTCFNSNHPGSTTGARIASRSMRS